MTEKRYNAPAAEAILEVLEFMAASPGPRGPTELARQLDLSANLTFRILNVLQDKKYVIRNDAGQYELTAQLFSLGMRLQNSFDLHKQSRPFLERLAAATGEGAQIQLPAGDRMLQLDFVPPREEYFLAVTPGIRVYYHGNAFGKAVLAFLPQAEETEILEAPLKQLTRHTVIKVAALQKELGEIRKTLVATEFDEYVEGSYCIGSPVFNAAGKVVAAVGITGLSVRFDPKQLPERCRQVRECAKNIAQAIGYTGDIYTKSEKG